MKENQHATKRSLLWQSSFAEDRCEVITTDENQLSSCDDLMQIVRDKLECLQFIPDEELRIQYKDDDDTFVNLRFGDSFHNDLRCAQGVSGTTFRARLFKTPISANLRLNMLIHD